MSFYGSQPAPNISSSQPSRQSPLNLNAWPTNPLDQFVFQDNDNSFNPNSMGGLRCPNPPPASTPASNYPPLSLADVSVADLANYTHDSINHDQFLLDSARLDFDDALHNRSSPNNFDTRQNPLRSHQPTSSTYLNSWDPSSAFAINPTNAAPPPESFDIYENIGVDSTSHGFISGAKHPQEFGFGSYVQRLISFNRDQRQGIKNGSLECFWKPLIASYFAPGATLCLDVHTSSDSQKPRVRVPVEALPRIWKSKFDAGVKEERMLLEDPCEFLLHNGVVVVDCPRTLIVTVYEHSMVLTDGHLKVSFQKDKKILYWEFSSQNHEEVFSRAACGGLGAVLPSSCSEYGMPDSVFQLMMIANDVHNLADKISTQVTKIASDPQKVSGLVNVTRIAEQKMGGGFSQFPSQSTGHAFRAISSVFDGASMERGMPLGSAGITHGGTGGSSSTRGFAGDLDMDMKNTMKNETMNPRDVLNSWRLDHLNHYAGSGPQNADQRHVAVFPNVLDEAVRSPFPGAEGDDFQGARMAYGELNVSTKGFNTNMSDMRSKQRGQSAIDGVAAAATGHGGWGAASSTRGERNTKEIETDGLGTSMQLLNTATNANLTLRPESGCGGRNNSSRQRAPPGLSLFTPQPNDIERGNKGTTRRGRGAKGGSRRGMNCGNARAKSNAQSSKDFNESLRGLQRTGSGKSKRGSGTESVQEGAGRGNDKDVSVTSQEQNGGVGFGKKGSRAEVVAGINDDGHVTVGARRTGTRASGTEERLEKRQKTSQDADKK